MPWIRLLLTALLASLALPGLANEGHGACAERVTGADSDVDPIACARTHRTAVEVAPLPTDALGIDCSSFALGGLASGVAAGSIPASELVSATLRQCNRRSYVFGVAMLVPPRGSGNR